MPLSFCTSHLEGIVSTKKDTEYIQTSETSGICANGIGTFSVLQD